MKKIIFYIFLVLNFNLEAQKDSLIYQEINFALDSYRLSADQKSRLDSVLELVPQTVLQRIEIYGHTDSLAGVEYNRKLSKRRVQSLLKYLVYKGTDPRMVSTDYYGEEKPAYDNGPEERYKNRRVELYLFIDPSLIPPPEQKLTDLPFEKGDKVRIPNLNFVGNQPIPIWQSFPALAELLEVMLQNPDLKIELQGHVCCGDDYELSLQRAAMVYHFLRSNDIDEKRLAYKGFSNSKPLFPEKTDREKALNRRVEVLVLDNSENRNKAVEKDVKIDVEARVLNIAFFPKKSRLMPSGDFMLTLIADMMSSSEGLFYEFVIVDNIDNSSITNQRAHALERKIRQMRVKNDIFSVRKRSRPERMPISENDNYIYVKIRRS